VLAIVFLRRTVFLRITGRFRPFSYADGDQERRFADVQFRFVGIQLPAMTIILIFTSVTLNVKRMLRVVLSDVVVVHSSSRYTKTFLFLTLIRKTREFLIMMTCRNIANTLSHYLINAIDGNLIGSPMNRVPEIRESCLSSFENSSISARLSSCGIRFAFLNCLSRIHILFGLEWFST